MGLRTVIARIGIRGVAKSMCDVYKQGKTMYPDLEEGQLCRDVIGSRYRLITPDPIEQSIISAGIDAVTDLYSACLLVVQAETGVNSIENNNRMIELITIVREEVDRFIK